MIISVVPGRRWSTLSTGIAFDGIGDIASADASVLGRKPPAEEQRRRRRRRGRRWGASRVVAKQQLLPPQSRIAQRNPPEGVAVAQLPDGSLRDDAFAPSDASDASANGHNLQFRLGGCHPARGGGGGGGGGYLNSCGSFRPGRRFRRSR